MKTTIITFMVLAAVVISTHGADISWAGSEFRITGNLFVSMGGDASLDITSGGLVSVGGTMSIQTGSDSGIVRMSTGGQLALSGSVYNLTEFYGLINGQDNIEY